MKTKCDGCIHLRNLHKDKGVYRGCNNIHAHITSDTLEIPKTWFFWPMDFNPKWIISCDGFSNNLKDNQPEILHDPLKIMLKILR